MGGTPLTSHTPNLGGPWTGYGDAPNAALLTGTGEVYDPTLYATLGNVYLIGPTSPTANELTQAIFHRRPNTDGELALVTRGIDAEHNYQGEYNADAGEWRIWRIDAGPAFHLLANVAGVFAVGTQKLVRFESIGTQHSLYVNNVLVATAADATYSAPGRPGWASYPDTSPTLTDGWALSDWVAGYQP